MSREPSRKPTGKTLCLDAVSAEALEYLKKHPAIAGMRFSLTVFFRSFLAALREKPDDALAITPWGNRGQAKGKSILVPLTPEDAATLAWLEDYYQLKADEGQRVRDGRPKQKRLPISQLLAQSVQEQARQLGWSPDTNHE